MNLIDFGPACAEHAVTLRRGITRGGPTTSVMPVGLEFGDLNKSELIIGGLQCMLFG